MGTEVAEVLGVKIGGVENVIDQAIDLTLRLGIASSIGPTHQPPDRHICEWPGGIAVCLFRSQRGRGRCVGGEV